MHVVSHELDSAACLAHSWLLNPQRAGLLLQNPAETLAEFADCVVIVIACVSLNERVCSAAACRCVCCRVPLDI